VNKKEDKKEFFDVSALIDERFGFLGIPSRIEAKEKTCAFSYGKIIEAARNKGKITQAELARRIGSDISYIFRIESGEIDPDDSAFYQIMVALGGNIEFLMHL